MTTPGHQSTARRRRTATCSSSACSSTARCTSGTTGCTGLSSATTRTWTPSGLFPLQRPASRRPAFLWQPPPRCWAASTARHTRSCSRMSLSAQRPPASASARQLWLTATSSASATAASGRTAQLAQSDTISRSSCVPRMLPRTGAGCRPRAGQPPPPGLPCLLCSDSTRVAMGCLLLLLVAGVKLMNALISDPIWRRWPMCERLMCCFQFQSLTGQFWSAAGRRFFEFCRCWKCRCWEVCWEV